jgi:hypothetical protein
MSRVQISAMLLWRVNLVSFISIGIREGEDAEEGERKREDAPSPAREARSISKSRNNRRAAH